MKAGDRILSYIVERELGEGGMGTVFLGRHTVLNQQVAIKALSPLLSRDQASRERFIREANIQAGLRHPGIVQVLTAEMEGDQPLLVMEYVDGKSLSEVLELRGALPIDDALKIMEQVLSAVGYAHRQGVIHRDLKPSNVMVMASGEVKVTDFGIAKVLGSSKLTRTGTAIGSAHYMSPEQIRKPESVDTRSDIYSLGCVFYEVLTGRPPFGEKYTSGTESDFEVKNAHIYENITPFKEFKNHVPLWLDTLVIAMLSKDPECRPLNCDVICEQVANASDHDKSFVVDRGLSKRIADGNYVGTIVNGKANGFGTWTNTNGTKYVGDFKDDRFYGEGTLIFASGSEYVGQFKNDMKHGRGTYIWASGEKYVGEYKSDKKSGKGTYFWPNGKKYIGEFEDENFNGKGTLMYENGDSYSGEFKNDKKHGQGTLSYANGEKYAGEFKNDMRHGKGTHTFPNGEKFIGKWENDERKGFWDRVVQIIFIAIVLGIARYLNSKY